MSEPPSGKGRSSRRSRWGVRAHRGEESIARRVGDARGIRFDTAGRFARRIVASRVLWPLGLLLWLSVVLFGLSVASRITSRRDLTIPEGSIVYSIESVSRGAPLYRDYRRAPYATSPYPPLYYLASATPLVCGLAGTGIEAAYRSGRAVTLVSALASLVMVALLARQTRASPTWAVGAGCLAITCPWIVPWGFTCRPDFPALALSLAGLLVFLRNPTAPGALAAVGWFLMAVMTKHSSVSAPMAIILGTLMVRAWRPAVTLLVSLVVGTVLTTLVVDWATSGLFLFNIMGANVTRPIWIQMAWHLSAFYLFFPGVLVLLGAMGIAPCLRHAGLPGRILVLYSLLSLGLAVTSSLKLGADRNYYLEPLFAAAVLSGRGMIRFEALGRRWRRSRAALLTVIAVASAPAIARTPELRLDLIDGTTDSERIFRHLAPIKGDVLFGDSGLAVRSGRPVLLLDIFNVSYLSDAGKLDMSLLLDRLERRQIAAVVLDDRTPFRQSSWGLLWWPRPLAEAIDRNYLFRGMVDTHFLYVPRTPDDETRIKNGSPLLDRGSDQTIVDRAGIPALEPGVKRTQ